MSRAERRRQARAMTKPPRYSEWVCVQMGCTNDEDLADLFEVKRQTHDLCIKMAGEHRTSGVSWMVFHGEAALSVARDALASSHPHDRDVYHGICDWLGSHPKARLVIASCNVADGAPHPFESARASNEAPVSPATGISPGANDA